MPINVILTAIYVVFQKTVNLIKQMSTVDLERILAFRN